MLKLLQIGFLTLITYNTSARAQSQTITDPLILKKLAAIEQTYHIKAGIYAEDTNTGQIIAYHARDRFAFQSTFKFIPVSALLAKTQNPSLLQKKVGVGPGDLVFWHPISGNYVNQPVSLQTLAEGAISYSDNPAINIIIRDLGGIAAINQFARDLGNASFNLKHYEVDLNSTPNQDADTSTPQDMGLSVKKIIFGDVLTTQNKALLLNWMKNNTTGYRRIRAGVPLGWSVADKTGSGSYGIANDIGIVWSPACKPIILSLFTVSTTENAKPNDTAIADITEVLLSEFSQHHACYRV